MVQVYDGSTILKADEFIVVEVYHCEYLDQFILYVILINGLEIIIYQIQLIVVGTDLVEGVEHDSPEEPLVSSGIETDELAVVQCQADDFLVPKHAHDLVVTVGNIGQL